MENPHYIDESTYNDWMNAFFAPSTPPASKTMTGEAVSAALDDPDITYVELSGDDSQETNNDISINSATPSDIQSYWTLAFFRSFFTDNPPSPITPGYIIRSFEFTKAQMPDGETTRDCIIFKVISAPEDLSHNEVTQWDLSTGVPPGK